MRLFFKCILITTCLFFCSKGIHAQTLNADTLAKYHVSKILTYTLDSTGQKVLKATRSIDGDGKTTEFSIRHEIYFDSILHSIDYDTSKYSYDVNNRIICELHTAKIITYSNNEEKVKYYSWINKTVYKNPFIINPFSKENISYVYYKNNEEITKRYSNGKCTGYFKYSRDSIHKYSVDKYYRKHYKRHSAKNKDYPYKRRRKRHNIFGRKQIIHTTATLNSYDDISKKNISQKTYYKKPVPYAYTKMYEYVYENSFMLNCKTTQPDFVTTSKTKNETEKNKYKRHKKRIYHVEERGTLVEQEFYEYITTP